MLPWNAEDLTFDADRFNGIVRLFPLPDLVMFPHVMQPLHVHESRYREMLNEALDSDGLLTMSVLAPGWEPNYEGRPALLPHACLGKIITHQRLDDGQYNLLLLGLHRVRLASELPPLRSFRKAEATLLEDIYRIENEDDRPGLQTALTRKFQACLPVDLPTNPVVQELLSAEISLGMLTDLVSFALPLEFSLKCALLAECDVDQRAWMLLDAMEATSPCRSEAQTEPRGSYLPPFSMN